MAVRFLTNEDKQELNDKIDLKPTDSKYFDIDYDGIISLKPEYRGHPSNETYPYAVSDNGVNVDGSLIGELPEKIVIPESIGNTAVSGFRAGMFHYNYHVKEIVLPDGVTELPDYFCRYARNLEAIHNTEGITKLGTSVIAYTMIEKALFPNLTDVTTGSLVCGGYLKVVDIGNNVTELPKQFLAQCPSLSLVKGGKSVTTIGDTAFRETMNLKNLPFLSNVTYIAQLAFWRSRIQFDWDSIKDKCEFGGDRATPVYDNPVDYWSGVEYTPCENPLKTILSKDDPRWQNVRVGKCTDEIETYGNNCGISTALFIHSALSGKEYETPMQFVDEVQSTSFGDITDEHNLTHFKYADDLFNALGYKTTVYETTTGITSESYKALCDALARGAYVYSQITVNLKTNPEYVNSGHVVCLYGINEIGEVMVADSLYLASLSFKEPGIDREKFLYSMPFANLTGPASDFVIVEKQ